MSARKTLPALHGHCTPDRHVSGCRPGRPKCRWLRAANPKRARCYCPAYAYPHRAGSGACGHPEALWEALVRSERDQAEAAERLAKAAALRKGTAA